MVRRFLPKLCGRMLANVWCRRGVTILNFAGTVKAGDCGWVETPATAPARSPVQPASALRLHFAAPPPWRNVRANHQRRQELRRGRGCDSVDVGSDWGQTKCPHLRSHVSPDGLRINPHLRLVSERDVEHRHFKPVIGRQGGQPGSGEIVVMFNLHPIRIGLRLVHQPP
jgi:hypothetical protein